MIGDLQRTVLIYSRDDYGHVLPPRRVLADVDEAHGLVCLPPGTDVGLRDAIALGGDSPFRRVVGVTIQSDGVEVQLGEATGP